MRAVVIREFGPIETASIGEMPKPTPRDDEVLVEIKATAANYVVAEVEQLVEVGGLNPEHIHTPGIFVDAVLLGAAYKKPIEKLTVRKAAAHV